MGFLLPTLHEGGRPVRSAAENHAGLRVRPVAAADTALRGFCTLAGKNEGVLGVSHRVGKGTVSTEYRVGS